MRAQRNLSQPRKGEQNIFRTIVTGTNNSLFKVLTGFIFTLSSYPSFIIEVLVRRHFGERYFSFMKAFVTVILMLGIYWKTTDMGGNFLGFTWVVFTLGFGYLAFNHRMNITKFGATYNFDRFSYCDGEILPFWWQLIGQERFGITITRYHIQVLFEPLLPFLTGVILSILPFTRGVGVLIIVCSLFFWFRNFMKSHFARDLVLDEIDEQIVSKWKHDVLVEQKPMSETKGLSLPIELPKSRELREDISNALDKNPLDIWEDELDNNDLIPA